MSRIALVTGAAGVLCSEMVRHLVTQGWKVALVGRTASKLEAIQQELPEGSTLVCAADVTTRADLEKVADKVHEAWGKIELLINGAGGNHPGATSPLEQLDASGDLKDSFFGMEMEAYENVSRLNLVGTVLPSQVFAEDMLESGGMIVNFSSVSALLPLTKVAGYSNAKAAVDSFTRWLAVHLAPRNVRVNAIMPGFFVTEQNRFLLYEKDGATPTARGQKVLNGTPMARFGDAKELLPALDYLIDERSTFVTGTVVPVDGGYVAYSGV